IIAEIIRALRSRGKTVLISSHIFSTLSDNCDRIYLLREGHIAQNVGREAFEQLDRDMRNFVVGDRVERLKF
ncbi:MAG TPA: ABC transporter ATP-binding protein, partial [Saprospiraceae bacterium]|nr:ABC transporter ATP-binding protein [Saprospiraceae bacterium]